jgi:hypothetical protein
MIEATNKYAAESGHWYKADGSPCYTVPYADPRKGERATTLRDAKKLNLFPSTTGVISVAARPGLEKWKAEQLLLAGLTLPRLPHESEKEWIARIYEDSRAQAEKAREGGIALHASLKRAFAGEQYGAEHDREIRSAHQALLDAFPGTLWKPEVTFASTMHGYGGAIDLLGTPTNALECSTIVDFKTTEFTQEEVNSGKKNLVWDEHIMQGAAYAAGLGLYPISTNIANLYISTTVPGLVYLHQWKRDEIDRGWNMFKALLTYWKASREYTPIAANV